MPHLDRPGQEAYLAELASAMRQVAGVRRTGSAAMDLAWVASGRFDGYWQHGLPAWDVAAGVVIVREAGGFVTDDKGGEAIFSTGSIVAGNQAVHGQLLSLLAKAGKPG